MKYLRLRNGGVSTRSHSAKSRFLFNVLPTVTTKHKWTLLCWNSTGRQTKSFEKVDAFATNSIVDSIVYGFVLHRQQPHVKTSSTTWSRRNVIEATGVHRRRRYADEAIESDIGEI